ncbi:ABC transporter permease [Demequina lignilytica]|uniref:ABC transporter permease n=1 Tax=Demequina lignilytica TaxID=3051663 RepID=A0AAW7M9N2_9MICO|nr:MULTISPECIES: ABC transporter permease [unclassified Demequina]MDN4477527.1 ABC transporter permease [Demequina sp. SYSU T00039-1]MDN4483571.1 ABC transporter permease [Demequina sp. SYSU T0a273]MDN4488122.1 ABC transporter permease [Demequina sp. SYSU T00039]MDN4490563.1 ABC transporter permease [Demequina sp. SYSU T00068]
MSPRVKADEPSASPPSAPTRSTLPSFLTSGLNIRALTGADWFSALAALLLLVAVIGLMNPAFFSTTQLINVVQQSVYIALMAAGIAFLLTQGEVDLSVAGNYVLTGIVASLLIQGGMNTWLAAAIALLCAVGVGAFNALIVQGIGINSLIATLAMGWVLRGLAAAVSEGKQIIGMPVSDPFFAILGGGKVLGLPVSVWILIIVVALLTVVLRATPFGYRSREIGSNPDAAAFAGIPVNRNKTYGFLLSGGLAGLAGLLGLAFFTSGDPTSGGGFELFAVAGAVIGGNPLTGGIATIFGAAIGAILLKTVGVGLVYFSIPAVWSQFATGAIIILAVSLNGLMARRKARRKKT